MALKAPAHHLEAREGLGEKGAEEAVVELRLLSPTAF